MDIIGKRYGYLTVIATSENIGKDTAWLVKCDCGNEKVLKTRRFKYGATKSCGCDISLKKKRESKYQNKKFGRLLVVKEVETDLAGGTRWLCRCDCGNEKIIRQSHLPDTQSCGCLFREQVEKMTLTEGEASCRYLYRNYKRQAPERGLSFTLNFEQFKKLTSGKCHYCGDKPHYKAKPHKYSNGGYVYNGIDRVDNNIGYEMDNCVSCCFVCNSMKKAYSYDKFTEHIKKICKNIEVK